MAQFNSQDKKRWGLLLAAFVLILACIIFCYLSQRSPEPEVAQVVGHTTKPKPPPKLTRPVRENTPRSRQTKKTVEAAPKTDTAFKNNMSPYGCLLKNEYDEQAGIVQQVIDKNCDGVADYCRAEELNEYGETVRKEDDGDCDGEPDRCYDMRYNKYGEEIAQDFDDKCDGSIDSCLSIKRNEYGDEIEEIFDVGCDGKLDDVEVTENEDGKGVLIGGDEHLCYSYEYDENGMITNKQQGNCGEEPYICRSYAYDPAAETRREKLDMDCDGTIEACRVKWMPGGNFTPHYFTENNCDGTWKNCMIWGEVNWVGRTFMGHDICAQKYEEIKKKYREGQ